MHKADYAGPNAPETKILRMYRWPIYIGVLGKPHVSFGFLVMISCMILFSSLLRSQATDLSVLRWNQSFGKKCVTLVRPLLHKSGHSNANEVGVADTEH
jgi:hypothetical protein